MFLIATDTECVLNYVVKTKFCHICKANLNASDQWKEFHEKDCCINHT